MMSCRYCAYVYGRKFLKKIDRIRPYMVMYQQPDSQPPDQGTPTVMSCEMRRLSKGGATKMAQRLLQDIADEDERRATVQGL
jgi:hypothetical protein